MANKKAKLNLLVANFDTESKTFQAFSDLKKAADAHNYFISQGGN